METMAVNTEEAKPLIIVLPTCKGIIVIPVQQIIRIQSISNYSKLFFKDGKTLVVAKVLHWFEKQNNLFSFVRIHRTHFINIQYIQSYSHGKSNLLFLQNGEMLPVARRKKASIAGHLNSLNNFSTGKSVSASPFNTKKNFAA